MNRSADWLVRHQYEPNSEPDFARQIQAQERLAELVPDADSIQIEFCDRIEFFDCGGNFERVCCPYCNAELPIAWW